LSKSERAEIDGLAQDKRLPASTMARAILLREAAGQLGERALQHVAGQFGEKAMRHAR
jgi:hypothetical protein